MDNYICIDGVKVLLNDSQISELRATLKENNMLVWATYTVNRVVEVPDDASDSDITEACATEAPCSYDEMVWDYFED